ncbi:DEAD/DEAH box helicase [Nitriliruptor sp.]|uniref:DEAD/DEAH box helicase n=1 Tax=Nitriliruptor sp. TaxID=2448056 RepID=UPI0034A01DBA
MPADAPTLFTDTGDDAATSFADLGLRPELLQVLDSLGYEEPTPIQREAIPPALGNRDLLGQAATGTGKTAAFALPVLHRLEDLGSRGRTPIALVLVPTRELAMQVSQAFHRYGRDVGARVLPIYGGQPIGRQIQALERGMDVVVATPGRALDHLTRGTLDLSGLEVVILDEADEMLDMGFQEDLDAILVETPEYHQTMLFSATMPPRIAKLAKAHLHEPIRITLGREDVEAGESPQIRQSAFVVNRAHKPAALGRVLDVESPVATLVFCRTRNEVDELTETMNGRGYRAEALHGGLSQEQRDRVMDRLRSQTADLLVATDVAARGLDVDHLTHVVNYDVPSAPEAYVHRIGRVGRAGREGVAITLVEPRQHRLLKAIERHTGIRMEVERVPTVADLRARRLELTRAALRESLLQDEDELDRFRGVIESLGDEFDLVEVALAAVKLAHESMGGSDDEVELPDVSLKPDAGGGKPGGKPGGKGKGGPKGRGPSGDSARIWVGLGRSAGIRPGDLVGAIAGESSVTGREIGAIEITHRFSLVEVPAGKVDEVIAALQATNIKGRKATVKRDRGNKGR